MYQKIKVKNFLFHRVNPVRDELWDPMDVYKFEQCVKYLAANYQVLSLEEVCSSKFSSASSKPLATISFDDGYHDNLEYAAPILQRYKCPASFYIVTDCIDEGCLVWTQEIKHYFQHTNQLRFNVDLSYFPEIFRIRSWKDRHERLGFARQIRDFLLMADPKIRDRFVEDTREAFQDVEPVNQMMSWDDVHQLHNAGFIIGSHTKSHPVLPTLTNEAELDEELLLSGQRIEDMLGDFPASLAYPFGAYNQAVCEAAERTGYQFGLTSNQQWYYSDRDGPYAISRTLLSNEPWLKTLSRMNGSFERIRSLIKGKPNHPWKTMLLAGKGVHSVGEAALEALNTMPY